uniref:TIGR00725 family protein n=1 Tax=candidate division WOR-3 bacterium TaxID=2052148 RepID=A0A7V0Z436_UNCW3
MRKKIIAVIGGAETSEKNLKIAEEVGTLIAKNGAIIITGGLGGVMEAASRGAKEAGGLVIGILPGTDKRTANEYVDIPIVTGMNQARNIIIARTADCAIAIDGRYGTLTEIAYCLMFNVPVIGINTWEIDAPIIHVKTAKQAITKALEIIGNSQ